METAVGCALHFIALKPETTCQFLFCHLMLSSVFSPMGDSDDEFDRRRRDKFRRERSDMERSREREERRRDDWPDR